MAFSAGQKRGMSLGWNQKRTPSCHWCFTSNSNGGFLGRLCCLDWWSVACLFCREMNERGDGLRQKLLSKGEDGEELHYTSSPNTLSHTATRTHTAELGLIISSSPSPGGSERLQALLWGCWRLPFSPIYHTQLSACTRSFAHWPSTHTYTHAVCLRIQHNWKNTVTKDGAAAVFL